MKKGILESALITGLKAGTIGALIVFFEVFLGGGERDWGYLAYLFMLFFFSGFTYRLISRLISDHTTWRSEFRVVFALVPAVIIVVMGVNTWFSMREVPLKPFQAHLNEYLLKETSTGAESLGSIPSNPIRGKIITINVKAKSVDPLFLQLSKDLKATRPEEVGTIVLLKRGGDLVASYTDGSNCSAQTVDVTIIDNMSGEKIAVKNNFRGDEPVCSGFSSGHAEDTWGPAPDDQIIAYLESLPHIAALDAVNIRASRNMPE
jgi:hypothetical protein